MYKNYTKTEIAVLGTLMTAALIYRIANDTKIVRIPSGVILLIWIFCIGYIFFNRSIKLLINAVKNRNNFCVITAEITEIKHFYMSRGGGYDYYIISYEYMNKSYSQEIHNSFSIKKWKKGDRIKIKVNKNAPDNIIIVFSDVSTAVLMSIIGLLFEAVPIAVYLHTHK